MLTKYSILFTVELQHDYYTGKLCKDFQIVPTPDCDAMFRNMQLLYKNAGNKLIVLASNDGGKPFINIDPTAVFRFYLLLQNPYFLNFTNADWKQREGKRYVFDNLTGNQTGSNLFLTRPLPVYAAGTSYLPGQLVMNNEIDRDVFEAIADNPSPSATTTDSAFWQPKAKDQYAGDADLTEFTGAAYAFGLSVGVTSSSVEIFGFNTLSGDFTRKIGATVITNYTNALTAIPVDLGHLRPGKYRIRVNGATDKMVYYDPQAINKNVYGVVEIHQHLPAANSFSVLGVGGTIRTTPNKYLIQFANRSVIWKYIFKTAHTDVVDGSPNNYQFSALGGSPLIFVSDKPIPLTQSPVKTFFMQPNNVGPPDPPLKNPAIDRLRQITTAKGTFYCSEIYINY
jgi:hypothetical protein